MNWVLGIDTSSIDMGLGLYNDRGPVASVERYVRNSHAEHLAQSIGFLFQSARITADCITHIAVALGPGSFTGLRIALAFVKGFCAGNGIPVLPLSSLQVMAHAASRQGGRIVTAIDARNGEIFTASFLSSTGVPRRTSPDRLEPAQTCITSLTDNDILVTDTMGYAASTVFTVLKDRANVYPVESFPLQRGLSCAALGLVALHDRSQWKSADEIAPSYLRQSAAQEKANIR